MDGELSQSSAPQTSFEEIVEVGVPEDFSASDSGATNSIEIENKTINKNSLFNTIHLRVD